MVLKSDCLKAVEMINACLDGAPSDTIVKEITNVTRHFEAFNFQFVRREGNAIADWVTKNCDVADVDIRIIDILCIYVNKLLLDDLSISHNVRIKSG